MGAVGVGVETTVGTVVVALTSAIGTGITGCQSRWNVCASGRAFAGGSVGVVGATGKTGFATDALCAAGVIGNGATRSVLEIGARIEDVGTLGRGSACACGTPGMIGAGSTAIDGRPA
jgi:hypothetical protein